jgi:hypothetical protein
MNFMKGLNCYAGFWDEPGIEKFPILSQGKSNFLKPVTPRLSQQVTPSLLTVGGFEPSRTFPDGTCSPSTVFFFVFHLPILGRARLPDSHLQVHIRAGQLPFFNFPIYARRTVKDRFILARTSCVSRPSPVALQSAAFFQALYALHGGFARLKVASGCVLLRASRFFRQCLIYFTERQATGLFRACRFLGKHGDI